MPPVDPARFNALARCRSCFFWQRLLHLRRPGEAEAYRLNRIETPKLNNAERAILKVRPRALGIPAMYPGAPHIEQPLRAREEQTLRAWRQRAAACEAGNRKSCDHR